MTNRYFDAIKNGNLTVLQEELTSLNINQKDDEGKTMLHYAISQNNLNAVKLLLRQKANIELKDNKGFLPTDIMYQESWTDYGFLSISLKEAYKEIELLLLSYMSSIIFINKKMLFSAAIEGSIVAVKEAIHSAGVWDVDIRLSDGRTPLHLAAKKGHSKVVMALLNQHQNNVKRKGFSMDNYINATDSFGKTALDYATENGLEEIIEIIKSQSEAKIIENQTLKETKVKSDIFTLQDFEQRILDNLLNILLQTDNIHGTLIGGSLENLVLNYNQTGTEDMGCYGIYVNNKGLVDLTLEEISEKFKYDTMLSGQLIPDVVFNDFDVWEFNNSVNSYFKLDMKPEETTDYLAYRICAKLEKNTSFLERVTINKEFKAFPEDYFNFNHLVLAQNSVTLSIEEYLKQALKL